MNQPPAAVAFRRGTIARESLPLDTVHYPDFYGTFFAFAAEPGETPRICECSRGSVENAIRLRDEVATVHAVWDDHHLPAALAQEQRREHRLRFAQGACHRCNLATPSLRYCSEMYGGMFVQTFGWYINETFFRLGMANVPTFVAGDEPLSARCRGYAFIPDVTPPELQDLVSAERDSRCRYLEAQEAYPTGGDELRPFRREAARANRRLTSYVENIVRSEFGFRPIGEGWISESCLARIVQRLLPDNECIRHHRPEWLQGLELDIFVPELSLAIEYQGQQHFYSIDAWGGESALDALQQRDARKAGLCKSRGVNLVLVDYTEPLTEAHIASRLGLD